MIKLALFPIFILCLTFGGISGFYGPHRLLTRADKGFSAKECNGLDRNGFNKLNKICDDCFSLFNEPEIYKLCRADCFGTKYFFGCMEAILVRDDLKSEVAAYLDDVHTSNSQK